MQKPNNFFFFNSYYFQRSQDNWLPQVSLPTQVGAQCRVERIGQVHTSPGHTHHQRLDSGNVFFRRKESVWYFTFGKAPKDVCSPGAILCDVPRALARGGLPALRGRCRELGADRTSLSRGPAGPLARLSRILSDGEEPRACSPTAGLSLPLPREPGAAGGAASALSLFLFSFFQNTDLRRVSVPCGNLSVSESFLSAPARILSKVFPRPPALFLDSAAVLRASLGEGAWLLSPGQARLPFSAEDITGRGRSNCLGSLIS